MNFFKILFMVSGIMLLLVSISCLQSYLQSCDDLQAHLQKMVNIIDKMSTAYTADAIVVFDGFDENKLITASVKLEPGRDYSLSDDNVIRLTGDTEKFHRHFNPLPRLADNHLSDLVWIEKFLIRDVKDNQFVLLSSYQANVRNPDNQPCKFGFDEYVDLPPGEIIEVLAPRFCSCTGLRVVCRVITPDSKYQGLIFITRQDEADGFHADYRNFVKIYNGDWQLTKEFLKSKAVVANTEQKLVMSVLSGTAEPAK